MNGDGRQSVRASDFFMHGPRERASGQAWLQDKRTADRPRPSSRMLLRKCSSIICPYLDQILWLLWPPIIYMERRLIWSSHTLSFVHLCHFWKWKNFPFLPCITDGKPHISIPFYTCPTAVARSRWVTGRLYQSPRWNRDIDEQREAFWLEGLCGETYLTKYTNVSPESLQKVMLPKRKCLFRSWQASWPYSEITWDRIRSARKVHKVSHLIYSIPTPTGIECSDVKKSLWFG